MRKMISALLCMAGLAMVTACGGGNKKTSDTTKEQVSEAAQEISKDIEKMNGAEQFEAALNAFGLNVSDATPEFKYKEKNEKGKYYVRGLFANEKPEAYGTFVKEDGGEIMLEEYNAFLTKVYKSTAGQSEGGKCVVGFGDNAKTKDEAMKEKPIDKVVGLKNGFGQPWTSVAWHFVKDGIFYMVDCDLKEPKGVTPSRITLKISQGLQKSLDAAIDEAEKALEDEDVQKAIKEKLGN
ncbi:MAG: hypothetical protein PUH24_05485 [Prevotellaceae bacterium]|nr:hypothetical protein [Prevotellaceae bacterium]MDY6130083.1 hypothetical protein [Prevotella sp.]